MLAQGVTGSILAAGLSLVFALALVPLARATGWMDVPSARKHHAQPTPLVGGPATWGGMFLVLALAGLLDAALLAACTLIMLTGLVDDRWPLGAWVRFGLQAMACLLMVFAGDVLLLDFGRLLVDHVLELGPLAVPITVFAALGVINAFNMIDGVDGLSGSIFVLCCIAAGVLAWRAGRADVLPLLFTAGGATLGFLALNARLPWNPRARIFLGDSGSLLLGLVLAWVFIDLGNGSRAGVDRAFAPMTAVWIFGLPLLDTTRLMANRWRAGRSAFEADEYHLHHAFARAGFSPGQTWMGIVAFAALFMVTGAVLEISGVPEYLRFYGFIACGLGYFHVMKRAWRSARFLGRPMRNTEVVFNT